MFTIVHTCVIIQVARERAVRAAARREDKVKAFRGWSRLKAITEAAVRCLQDIDAPTEEDAETPAQECWLEVRENGTRRLRVTRRFQEGKGGIGSRSNRAVRESVDMVFWFFEIIKFGASFKAGVKVRHTCQKRRSSRCHT